MSSHNHHHNNELHDQVEVDVMGVDHHSHFHGSEGKCTAKIKNQANEDVDLSKLSDTTMMHRIIGERIKLNMAKII